MKNLPLRILFIVSMWLTSIWFGAGITRAQTMPSAEGPKAIIADDGSRIQVYPARAESFNGRTLQWQSAISVQRNDGPGADPNDGVDPNDGAAPNDGSAPLFGLCRITAIVETDKNKRTVVIDSLKVTRLDLPAGSRLKKKTIRALLETHLKGLAATLSLDAILASLDRGLEEKELSSTISHQAPKLIFRNQQTMLVLIDGAPRLQKNKQWGLDVVINSPFTIVRFTDGHFYLYGGQHWYVAPAAEGPYVYTNDDVRHKLKKIAREVEKTARENAQAQGDQGPGRTTPGGDAAPILSIAVSTTPAALIQTVGNPLFTPIGGTSLQYVANTDNDIFLDSATRRYYILLSGRWFTGDTLSADADWQYVPATQLPADFARIPPGSPVDNVLASVPGTKAARMAVRNAELPQTSKIDRQAAGPHIDYDGAPQFRPIEGTSLEYAVNTCATVFESGGTCYALDESVWYTSKSPQGPWVVSTDRPDEVDLIPPTYPVYHAKYVEIYDVEPAYVVMGYTAGYLDSYIDDSTLVYGTGYDYDPWLGGCYCPRPWTWGFDVFYNPWIGWDGVYAADWFDDCAGWAFGFDWGAGIGWGGGGRRPGIGAPGTGRRPGSRAPGIGRRPGGWYSGGGRNWRDGRAGVTGRTSGGRVYGGYGRVYAAGGGGRSYASGGSGGHSYASGGGGTHVSGGGGGSASSGGGSGGGHVSSGGGGSTGGGGGGGGGASAVGHH